MRNQHSRIQQHQQLGMQHQQLGMQQHQQFGMQHQQPGTQHQRPGMQNHPVGMQNQLGRQNQHGAHQLNTPINNEDTLNRIIRLSRQTVIDSPLIDQFFNGSSFI